MKKKLVIWAAIIIVIVLGVVFVLIKNKKPVQPPTPGVQQVSWRGILAGVSSTKEVIDELGPPKEKKAVGSEEEALLYPSTNKYYDNEIQTKQDKVSFIREYLFEGNLRSLKNKLDQIGSSYTKLYGPNSNSGIFLFVYPEKGIAFLANPLSDLIFEVWYFPAISLDAFLSQPYSQGYSATETQRPD